MTIEIAQLGHPLLCQRAEPVIIIDEPGLRELVATMMAALQENPGLGIAAPQLYVGKRVLIMASRPTVNYPQAPAMEPTAMINPEILTRSPEIEWGWEGCLSVPGFRGRVPRHRAIQVSYFTLDGQQRMERFEGFPAVIFQHEYDHLEGKVYLARMENWKELVTEREFQRLQGRE